MPRSELRIEWEREYVAAKSEGDCANTLCRRPAAQGRRLCENHLRLAREARRRERAAEPEKHRAQQRDFKMRRRRTVLDHYGGACECCGEDRFEFLALDHKDGGGNQHRKEVGARGNSMIGWIIANGFPPLFRVLCHNCNQAIGFYGSCPHEHERPRMVVAVGGDNS